MSTKKADMDTTEAIRLNFAPSWDRTRACDDVGHACHQEKEEEDMDTFFMPVPDEAIKGILATPEQKAAKGLDDLEAWMRGR